MIPKRVPLAKSRLVIVALVVGSCCVLVGPSTAGATPFHEYALVYNGASSNIIAIQQTRYDSIPTGIPSGTNCTTPFAPTSNPVYQSEWVDQSAAPSWVEFGTGHQCSGYEYWFAGDGNNGSWNLQWYQAITGSGQHTFYMFRNTTGGVNTWHWEVDSTVENSWVSSWSGFEEEAGLESYVSGAVNSYQITALNYYTTGNTSWRAFSSDSTYQDSSMCVDLLSQTSANVGENVSNPSNCT